MGVRPDPGRRLIVLAWLLNGIVGGWWDSVSGFDYASKLAGWAVLCAGTLGLSSYWLWARERGRTRRLGSSSRAE